MEPGKGEENQNEIHAVSFLLATWMEPSRAQQGRADCQVLPHRTLRPGRTQGPGFFMSHSHFHTCGYGPSRQPPQLDTLYLPKVSSNGATPRQTHARQVSTQRDPEVTFGLPFHPIPYGQCHAEQVSGSPAPLVGFQFPHGTSPTPQQPGSEPFLSSR